MSKSYSDFNMYNCAPDNCGLIAVYKNNTKIGYIKVPKRMIVSNEKRLYSFLSISDSHTVRTNGDDGTADLTRAITFANNNDIAFVCHCGDTADSGTDYHMTGYKNIVANCTKPVYAISGNHQEVTSGGNINLGYNDVTQYHGYPLYYSFEYKNDVFVMLGESGYTTGSVFCDGELQFMYDTLEANRNKRCFVYQHIFNWEDGDSGNPNKLYHAGDLFTVTGDIEYRKKERQCFLDMLKHYKNTIWVITADYSKPLSARQGKILKELVDKLESAINSANTTANNALSIAVEARSTASNAWEKANEAKTAAETVHKYARTGDMYCTRVGGYKMSSVSENTFCIGPRFLVNRDSGAFFIYLVPYWNKTKSYSSVAFYDGDTVQEYPIANGTIVMPTYGYLEVHVSSMLNDDGTLNVSVEAYDLSTGVPVYVSPVESESST